MRRSGLWSWWKLWELPIDLPGRPPPPPAPEPAGPPPPWNWWEGAAVAMVFTAALVGTGMLLAGCFGGGPWKWQP